MVGIKEKQEVNSEEVMTLAEMVHWKRQWQEDEAVREVEEDSRFLEHRP